MGGKGTDFDDTIVFKASGGQTLTMVHVYYGTVESYAYGGILRLRYTVRIRLRSYDRMLLKSYVFGGPYAYTTKLDPNVLHAGRMAKP